MHSIELYVCNEAVHAFHTVLEVQVKTEDTILTCHVLPCNPRCAFKHLDVILKKYI
jgi:hypothetical protein